MLYAKQAALEAALADAAAARLQAEAVTRRDSTGGGPDTGAPRRRGGGLLSAASDVVPTDVALGDRYARLAARPRVGRAVRAGAGALDAAAALAVRLLRLHPGARAAAAAYLACLHLFVWALMGRHAAAVPVVAGLPGV
jgi:hypothetical protein